MESKEPWRYRIERMTQKVMGVFMGKGKPAADPELAEIVEGAERVGFDWGQVSHLAKAVGTFFSEGLMGILSQIEAGVLDRARPMASIAFWTLSG